MSIKKFTKIGMFYVDVWILHTQIHTQKKNILLLKKLRFRGGSPVRPPTGCEMKTIISHLPGEGW